MKIKVFNKSELLKSIGVGLMIEGLIIFNRWLPDMGVKKETKE